MRRPRGHAGPRRVPKKSLAQGEHDTFDQGTQDSRDSFPFEPALHARTALAMTLPLGTGRPENASPPAHGNAWILERALELPDAPRLPGVPEAVPAGGCDAGAGGAGAAGAAGAAAGGTTAAATDDLVRRASVRRALDLCTALDSDWPEPRAGAEDDVAAVRAQFRAVSLQIAECARAATSAAAAAEAAGAADRARGSFFLLARRVAAGVAPSDGRPECWARYVSEGAGGLVEPAVADQPGAAPHGRAGLTNKQRRGILRDWFYAHLDDPYPSPAEKDELCLASGLTFEQVNTFFVNIRQRNKEWRQRRRERGG